MRAAARPRSYPARKCLGLYRMQLLVSKFADLRRVHAAFAFALAVAWLLAAGGCGFHLQGAGTLPPAMARTYVDTDRPHTVFLESLTDVLRQRGAEVLEAPTEGAAVLDISSDETG